MSVRVVAPATSDSLFPTVLTINSFRAIIEGIETPVLIADRTGRLLAANGAAKIVFELRELSAAHSVFEYLFQSDGTELLEEATGVREGANLLSTEPLRNGDGGGVRGGRKSDGDGDVDRDLLPCSDNGKSDSGSVSSPGSILNAFASRTRRGSLFSFPITKSL